MRRELDEMKRAWEELGIGRHFKKVHHFSSHLFSTSPGGLMKFYNWCVRREIEQENSQTIRRALEVARLFRLNGGNIDAAIKSAWDAYPVVMR